MLLTVDSDTEYLVASKARSKAAGYFYLGKKCGKFFNVPIFVLAEIIKAVMASAAYTEFGGLYIRAQESVPISNKLIEVGNLQPPDGTPFRTDNSTADGIINRTVKPNKFKSMDMRFCWLVDRLKQHN